jgi:hypothetical protein
MEEWNVVDEHEEEKDYLWPKRELIRVISLLKAYNFEYQGIVPFGARHENHDVKYYRRDLAKGENLRVVARCLNQMGYENDNNKFDKEYRYSDKEGGCRDDHIVITLDYSLQFVNAKIQYASDAIPAECENDANLN